MAGTEESRSELIGNKGVEESSPSELIGEGSTPSELIGEGSAPSELIGEGSTTSVLSSHRTEKLEERRSEGETLVSGSWVGGWDEEGRRCLGFHIKLLDNGLGFEFGAQMGLTQGGFPV